MRIKDTEVIELSKIVDFFKPHEIQKHVLRLREGNVTLALDEMVERLKQIKSLGRDSSSLNSFIVRYGEIHGRRKWEIKTNKCKFDKAKFLNKVGEEKGLAMLRNRGASEEIYTERYGPILGKQKWEEYKSKRNDTYQNRKKEGRDYNSFSIEKYIKKYGEEIGKTKYNEMVENRIFKTSKQYLIEEHGPEVAGLIAKDRWNNTSLSSFIKRYGETDGKIKYETYTQLLRNNMSFDFLIQKYGEEEGTKKYLNNCWKQNNGSRIATELFENIIKETNINANYGNIETIIFLNTTERALLNQKVIFPDFCFGNKIIEFYGDMWHANPNKFKDTDYPNPFNKDLTSVDIREKDKRREELLCSKGYDILIIWENDYKTNKRDIISKCINFLKD